MHTATFAEFFCGGGMVRAALDGAWACVLANDIDPKKCAAYRSNWGGERLIEGDVAALGIEPLKRDIDLYWASSPCQDFSSAGRSLGLGGDRSSTFLTWAAKVAAVVDAGYAPRLIAFENVTGLLSRSLFGDLLEIVERLSGLGYRLGGLEIDAKHYVPQSRPRLFLIAARDDLALPAGAVSDGPSSPFHTAKLCAFASGLGRERRRRWLWWRLDAPDATVPALSALLDRDGEAVWHSAEQTRRLVALMSPANLQKLLCALKSRERLVGTLYRRGRPDGDGVLRQQAEVRFDGVAGCIRTPAGGSSRQIVVQVADGGVRTRLMSPREALRLMGLPDSFEAPESPGDAYRIAGDGVCVPIVRHLRDRIFDPVIADNRARRAA